MASLLNMPARMAASSSRAASTRTHSRLRTILGILLLLNGVLVFFLFRSPGMTATERQAEVMRLEAQQRSEQQRVQQLTNLQQKVQDATQNEQKFSQANFLSRSSAFSSMLTDLEKLASENHLQPGSASYHLNDSDNKLGWTNVEVTLDLEGDYPNVVRFLNQLEKSDLFWIVEAVDVSGRESSKLRLNLQVATYLLPS